MFVFVSANLHMPELKLAECRLVRYWPNVRFPVA